MSWIVQRLLMETPTIKETHDFESDDYNNLLIIEKKISGMMENTMFSMQEIQILTLIQEGYLFGDIEPIIGLGRDTVSKIYKNICERIAFSLGGEFTDDGFIREVSRKNHLSLAEQDKLARFMESNLKHKILRKPTHPMEDN
jgi:hypothetical protein